MRPRWLTLVVATTLGLVACGSPAVTAPPLGSSSVVSESEARIMRASEQERLAAGEREELQDDPAFGEESLWPSPPPDDLGNFGELSDRLFRGARPTEKGMQTLKAKGVALIVDLENDKKVVERERALAQKYGIGLKSIPMGIFIPPKVAKVDEFLQTVQDPAQGKIYFHCMQGRDRTGTMAFCYRVRVDRWTTGQAFAEMKQFKFHTYLVGLNWFVHWYGDKYGPKAPQTAVAPAF
jgi:hypothetical protein